MTKKNRRSSNGASNGTRITVDLSPNGYERLQRLGELANMSSASVIRQALQLFEFVIERTDDGSRFKYVDKSGRETEVNFLGFSD
jgi:hypothetical protein